MTDGVYDMPIEEVANLLDKSDRQVRRYVREKGLEARAMRVDGHLRLMFCRDEVLAFKERVLDRRSFTPRGRGAEVVVDGRLIGGPHEERSDEPKVSVIDDMDVSGAAAVKYVINALREQMAELQRENRELHYQLEQRSGQVGFLQGKVETLQDELKMLAPAQASQEEIIKRKPWYRRVFGRG